MSGLDHRRSGVFDLQYFALCQTIECNDEDNTDGEHLSGGETGVAVRQHGAKSWPLRRRIKTLTIHFTKVRNEACVIWGAGFTLLNATLTKDQVCPRELRQEIREPGSTILGCCRLISMDVQRAYLLVESRDESIKQPLREAQNVATPYPFDSSNAI
ncbi:hypothetical protein SCHPADRAFT_894864 [Schizopora paradoxa]|uniref:Uncharacterized protein n=1 Tax=Schizopora paradoxa TaxID=27342 RepID=A0A0H2RCF6_9AGAM|nr:hypothetical protein SCHPADRAFT_894864 [Schizopora paradoxa]